MVMVLGFVSLTGMQTDLLPNMNLPYLLVITTYPGASPEQVESDVTQPLENSLSTLNGVKNVTSQSNENYSLVILEYQDDTDMDSAMVKASTAVNQLSGSLPDMASTPTLMEMSPDMMATQYVAVDYEGMDIYELSDYVEDTIVPQLERVDGVASVSTTGLVKKSVQITLDQDKIDEVNDKLLVKVSDRLAEAKKQLDENEAKIKDGLAELDSAQSQLDSGKAQLNTQKQSLTQQLRDAIDQLNEEIRDILMPLLNLEDGQYTAFAASISSMMVRSYAVAIVKPAEGKTDEVKAALEAYVVSEQQSMEHYLEDQYLVAKAATVTVAPTGEVVLVCAEDHDTILANIEKALAA